MYQMTKLLPSLTKSKTCQLTNKLTSSPPSPPPQKIKSLMLSKMPQVLLMNQTMLLQLSTTPQTLLPKITPQTFKPMTTPHKSKPTTMSQLVMIPLPNRMILKLLLMLLTLFQLLPKSQMIMLLLQLLLPLTMLTNYLQVTSQLLLQPSITSQLMTKLPLLHKLHISQLTNNKLLLMLLLITPTEYKLLLKSSTINTHKFLMMLLMILPLLQPQTQLPLLISKITLALTQISKT